MVFPSNILALATPVTEHHTASAIGVHLNNLFIILSSYLLIYERLLYGYFFISESEKSPTMLTLETGDVMGQGYFYR